ncbi:hypothetical protein ACFQ2M_13755 [Kitasatospora saccharophila]|uniref:hypothetical protein n=1 Tax=Kitasatospora saccharophila TaxID=407973 RepID=UPI00363F2B29
MVEFVEPAEEAGEVLVGAVGEVGAVGRAAAEPVGGGEAAAGVDAAHVDVLAEVAGVAGQAFGDGAELPGRAAGDEQDVEVGPGDEVVDVGAVLGSVGRGDTEGADSGKPGDGVGEGSGGVDGAVGGDGEQAAVGAVAVDLAGEPGPPPGGARPALAEAAVVGRPPRAGRYRVALARGGDAAEVACGHRRPDLSR